MTEDDILWLYAPEERADWRRVDALIEKRGEEALAEIRRMAREARQQLYPPPTPDEVTAQTKINRVMQEMAMYQAVNPWMYGQNPYQNLLQRGLPADWTKPYIGGGLFGAIFG